MWCAATDKFADDGALKGIPHHYLRVPHAGSGQTVGLFGGSFNPPHEGHVHVSEQALRRLGLAWMWWLVTPGNPLKENANLAPLAQRIAACEAITQDPRMVITACEMQLPSRYTYDTILHIKARNPDVKFVWVMGADNLQQFDRWHQWRKIADLLPIAVVDRPGSSLSLLSAKAAHALRRYRFDENDAPTLGRADPPAWVFLRGPRNFLSSTKLRALKK